MFGCLVKQGLLDEYVKSMKGKGLPGDEALKFCIDQLKKLTDLPHNV
jgi:hypothetical protein